VDVTFSEVLLNSIPLPVLAIDQNGYVIAANAAARDLLAPDSGEAQGQHLETLFPHLTSVLGDLEAMGAGFRREVQLGETMFAQAAVAPIPGYGWAITLYDISEYKEDADRKNQLLGEVTHDLKQPLAAILSFSDLVKAAGELTPKQMQFLERIRNTASRMSDQVHQLLDVAWIESGMKLTLGETDLREIVRMTIEEAEPRAAEKQIQLKLSAPEMLPTLTADTNRLRQVITNLVNNAIKYSKQKSAVSVSITQNADEAVISIRDQGFGIAPEHLPRLFERFYRVKDERTRKIEGTGLGLYISQSIIEQHSGRIDVESEPGVCSTFAVHLPLNLQPAAASTDQDA
jgi:two-component system phosphate regulon sensor histidine kinase PhoR